MLGHLLADDVAETSLYTDWPIEQISAGVEDIMGVLRFATVARPWLTK